jgi:hypothetical protein
LGDFSAGRPFLWHIDCGHRYSFNGHQLEWLECFGMRDRT